MAGLGRRRVSWIMNAWRRAVTRPDKRVTKHDLASYSWRDWSSDRSVIHTLLEGLHTIAGNPTNVYRVG